MNDKYGDFTNDIPKDVIDNHLVKIHVLEDALDYMHKENPIKKFG